MKTCRCVTRRWRQSFVTIDMCQRTRIWRVVTNIRYIGRGTDIGQSQSLPIRLNLERETLEILFALFWIARVIREIIIISSWIRGFFFVFFLYVLPYAEALVARGKNDTPDEGLRLTAFFFFCQLILLIQGYENDRARGERRRRDSLCDRDEILNYDNYDGSVGSKKKKKVIKYRTR